MRICAISFMTVIFLSGCSSKTSSDLSATPEGQFARKVCESLLKGDEAVFLSSHLTKDDSTPDGQNSYTTKRGGNIPDASWTALIKQKYYEARKWIEQKKSAGENFSFEKVSAMDKPENPNDWEKEGQRVYSMSVVIKSEKSRHIMKFGESVMTRRGRALLENPGVVFEEYAGNPE